MTLGNGHIFLFSPASSCFENFTHHTAQSYQSGRIFRSPAHPVRQDNSASAAVKECTLGGTNCCWLISSPVSFIPAVLLPEDRQDICSRLRLARLARLISKPDPWRDSPLRLLCYTVSAGLLVATSNVTCPAQTRAVSGGRSQTLASHFVQLKIPHSKAKAPFSGGLITHTAWELIYVQLFSWPEHTSGTLPVIGSISIYLFCLPPLLYFTNLKTVATWLTQCRLQVVVRFGGYISSCIS